MQQTPLSAVTVKLSSHLEIATVKPEKIKFDFKINLFLKKSKGIR